MPPHVEPVREAAAEELSGQREQGERQGGAEPPVPASALHYVSLHHRTCPVQTTTYSPTRLGEPPFRETGPGGSLVKKPTHTRHTLPLTKTGVRHRFWRF